MLVCETTDHLTLILDKASLREALDLVVDGVSATYQVGRNNEKRTVDVGTLMEVLSNGQWSALCQLWEKQYLIICKTPGIPSENVAAADDECKETVHVHDDEYYLEMAAFEVQQTDFLVPKHLFLQRTDAFSLLFDAGLGVSEQPIKLPDIAVEDFRSMMGYLYPLSDQKPTASEWISTLRLSTKWKMLEARAEAIEKLGREELSSVQKVELGFECKITEWAREGCVHLLERETHFQGQEVEHIGLDRVVKLCELREQRLTAEWDLYLDRFTLDNHGPPNLTSRCFLGNEKEGEGEIDLVECFLSAQARGDRRPILDACDKLARRIESLTLSEVNKLGLRNSVNLWEIRLEMRKAAWSMVQDIGATSSGARAAHSSISNQIDTAFGQELEALREQESQYAPSRRSAGTSQAPAITGVNQPRSRSPPSRSPSPVRTTDGSPTARVLTFGASVSNTVQEAERATNSSSSNGIIPRQTVASRGSWLSRQRGRGAIRGDQRN